MPQLTVSRELLVAACKRLYRLVPSRTREVTELSLSMEGGELILGVQGGQEAVPAEGDWRGRGYIAGNALVVMARSMIAGDPIHLSVQGDRLVFQGEHAVYKVKLRWEDIGPSRRYVLPLDASDFDVLVDAARMNEAEIVSSGLQPRLAQAEAQLVRRSKKAAAALDGFKVNAEDVCEFIRTRILERAAK